MDQGGDGDMKLGLMIATGIIGMHSSGFVQYPYDSPFRQKVSAVQRAHRRFTDCEGGGSGNVRDIWQSACFHWPITYHAAVMPPSTA